MTNDRAMCSFVTLDSAAGRASRAVCVLLATFSVYPFRRFLADVSERPGFTLMRPVYSAVRLGFYNNTFLNCLPGSCPTMPFISKLKRLARTSLEFNPLFSTRSSTRRGSPALDMA
jgi:hypothetical protein